MKVIPLGLDRSVSTTLRKLSLIEYSYPFTWLLCPSKTTYEIFKMIVDNGLKNNNNENVVQYMTSGLKSYNDNGNNHFTSVNNYTGYQMNPETGLGYIDTPISDRYIYKLRLMLNRLVKDIKMDNNLLLIYADAPNPDLNYYLDDVEYGVDATDDLLQIYDLIHPVNNNIKIVYFCWNERKRDNDNIEYVPFNYKENWNELSELIENYIIDLNGSF